jgi:hypothetical protein
MPDAYDAADHVTNVRVRVIKATPHATSAGVSIENA